MSTVTTDQGIVIPVGTDGADNPQAFVDQIGGVETRLVLRYASDADRLARHTAPLFGDLSIVAGNTWYDRWTGAKWMPVTPISSFKTGSQLVNNSTALVALTSMVVSLPAINTNYAIDGYIVYNSSTVADIKFSGTIPAGAASSIAITGGAVGIAAASGDANFAIADLAAAQVIQLGGAGVGINMGVMLSGAVSVGATAGNLQLTFAQNTLEATNTTVGSRSWLSARAVS